MQEITIQTVEEKIKNVFGFNHQSISRIMRDESLFRLKALDEIVDLIILKIGTYQNGDVKYKLTDCWTKNSNGDSIIDVLGEEQLNKVEILSLIDVLISKFKLSYRV